MNDTPHELIRTVNSLLDKGIRVSTIAEALAIDMQALTEYERAYHSKGNDLDIATDERYAYLKFGGSATVHRLIDSGKHPVDIATELDIPLADIVNHARTHEVLRQAYSLPPIPFTPSNTMTSARRIVSRTHKPIDTTALATDKQTSSVNPLTSDARRDTLGTSERGETRDTPHQTAHLTSTTTHTRETTMSNATISNAAQAHLELGDDALSFAKQFQGRVRFAGSVTLDGSEYADAISEVDTSQVPVSASKVKTITNSIVKDNQLWIAPTVAQIEGEDTYYMVSGRHRGAAIEHIVNNYVIDSKGKLWEADKFAAKFPEGDYQELRFEVTCNLVTVSDKVALKEYLLAANGSRSMTAYEKSLANHQAGTLKPLEQIKFKFADLVYDAIRPFYKLTPQTANSIASATLKYCGAKAGYATDSQLESLAGEYAKYLETHENAIPSNFAREFGQLVSAVTLQKVEVEVETEGDITYDELPLIEVWTAELAKPETKKATKALSKSAAEEVAAMLEAMAAMTGKPIEELQAEIAARRAAKK